MLINFIMEKIETLENKHLIKEELSVMGKLTACMSAYLTFYRHIEIIKPIRYYQTQAFQVIIAKCC